jgi:hypothetical protein
MSIDAPASEATASPCPAARVPIQQLASGGKHVVNQQRLFCRRNSPPLAPIASANGKLTS